jgi:hypothetical protein
VIVKVGDSDSTAWDVGQGLKPVTPSNLKKSEPESKPEPEPEPEPETKEEAKEDKSDHHVFDEIMNGAEDEEEEEEDISSKLNRDELRIIQRVMANSVKISEVFFDDDIKTRKKTLKIINKVVG